MTSSNGIPAELERGSNRPAGCGRDAHNMNFRFGASHLAADQRAVSPVCAGPASAFLPLASQGIFSKDPGSHNVVSSRLDVCRQPSLTTRGLFLTRGCVDRALNIGLTARNQPASYPRRECPERLPCVGLLHPQKMEQTHGEIAASEYVTARRGA